MLFGSCHWPNKPPLEVSQWFCLNLAQSVVAGLNFQNIYFRELLLMAAMHFRALIFWNTSNWMLSSLNNFAIVFKIFLYNESPKKHVLILTSMMRGKFIVAFHHFFINTFYVVTLQKLFFTKETLTFWFLWSDKLSTLNIVYVKVIYLKGSFWLTFK